MEDETKPSPDEGWTPANDNHPLQRQNDDSDIAPWQKLDKVVLSIARLIGRQMAREDFERLHAATANDNDEPRSTGDNEGEADED
ncbi:hypothetical protein SAMN05216358_2418 [Rhizobium sp. AN5]|uniref:hypothetical protein n=1 Tax=Rhizobium sp. AN5 TaxID=1855304 RepID=UPI000BD4AB75|nr:hypothetical protein [Rhizobium sp. AN5]SOC92276.1 hypothetical protein SAMN05216358_2418 [Rhizobium sp. AN5]